MPLDDDHDLYDGDYEFVDDEEYADSDEYEADEDAYEEEEAVEEKPKKKTPSKSAKKKSPASSGGKKKKSPAKKTKQRKIFADDSADEKQSDGATDSTPDDGTATPEGADEYGRTAPTSNYVVHIYELKEYRRTIDRQFTPEEADAFADEYNRTGRIYGRWAVPGKADVKPGAELAP